MLAEKKGDVTIVDACCGKVPYLAEMKRHLLQHGISARTIGIDNIDWGIVVDEFVHSDVRDVKLGCVADAVMCSGMEGFFRHDEFQQLMSSCAGFMKPDALFFTQREYKNEEGNKTYDMRAIPKLEVAEHAKCYDGECGPFKCEHGVVRNRRWFWTTRVDKEVKPYSLDAEKISKPHADVTVPRGQPSTELSQG